MKNIWIIPAVILLLASCLAEQDMRTTGTSDEGFRFYSTCLQSRTIWKLEDGVSVKWSEGDLVSLWGETPDKDLGKNLPYFVKPDIRNASSCTFIPEEDVVRYAENASVSIYGYYPYMQGQDDASSISVSIPEEQNLGTGTAHLSDLCVFRSDPVSLNTAEEDAKDINLQFRNVFPVIELAVSLENSHIKVPLKEIRLTSAAGKPLSYPEAKLDLRSEDISLTPVSTSSSLCLKLDADRVLEVGKPAKFCFVIAPQQHASGEIQLELVAIDHSCAKVSLLGGIDLKPGKVYRKAVSVSLNDFSPANPFNVVQEQVSAAAGEKIRFDFGAEATEILLYTGTLGCDYEHNASDRFIRAESMNMSFTMRGDPSGSDNSFNPSYAAISYATDIEGEITEDSMNKATWNDISSRFTLPTQAKTDTPSGTFNLMEIFPEDKDDIYIRYHYRFDAGTNSVGRTIIYVKNFQITSLHSAFEPVTDYNQSNTDWNIIIPEEGLARVNVSDTQIQFTATSWKPAEDGQAWVIAKVSVHKYNMGKDKPLSIKSETDAMPQYFEISYDEPGSYKAVFVVRTNTLFGTEDKVVEIPVTIN